MSENGKRMELNQLRRLASDLEMAVIREVRGHDRVAAAGWADDLVEEAFAAAPRPSLLKIYLNEIEKKLFTTPESRELIEVLRRLIG
jgi:hypothetical protein